MIPLRDVIPSRTTPWVTIAIIAVNAAVFILGWIAHPEDTGQQEIAFQFGLIPAQFSWVSVLTSMFVHGGLVHVASNLLPLWIFGDNVEDRLGHGRYFLFYLLCGAAAAYAEVLAGPDSPIPLVGASGAIAGVMGAYIVLFPHSRILVLVFLFLFLDIWEIPALAFLGLWFVGQVFGGVGRLAEPAQGGVAYLAHLGGFAAGVALVFLLRRREREEADWWARGIE